MRNIFGTTAMALAGVALSVNVRYVLMWCDRPEAPVSTIAEWLASLGMSEYNERFAEERIEIDVLSELTDQDLERLGIPLGHRRRMLRAIRERGSAPAASQVATATVATPQDNVAN